MKISAIVPVFNEEKTVSRIIKTLLKNKFINEVIVVNDGSSDSSLKILKSFKKRIKLIDLKKNHGKGRAIAEGIKKAHGEIVVFFDADLTNLNNQYVNQLIKPLINKKFRGTIGILTTKSYLPIIFPPLAGLRAYFRKDLIDHFKAIRNSKYGVEAFFNKLFKGKEVKKVSLRGLKYLRKNEKRSNKEAFKEYIKMYKEIAKEMVK
ncbi:MAG: glycosyltransferase family 2 protein [Candidatus Beckwithbacteria bacterium]|nr:glycosyltransferase family 2 protein [Candidatus Beckwithbacteria bacterium]